MSTMYVVVYLLFFIPFAFGFSSLTVDRLAGSSVNNAVKVTEGLLALGQLSQQSIIFIPLAGSELNLDSYFRQLPSTATVSIISWKQLIGLYEEGFDKYRFRNQLIVLVMDSALEVRSLIGIKWLMVH
jgi:hypothetical protein